MSGFPEAPRWFADLSAAGHLQESRRLWHLIETGQAGEMTLPRATAHLAAAQVQATLLVAENVSRAAPVAGSADANPDALQVLLADPKLLKLLRTAIADPGQFEGRGGKGAEPVEAWQARAVRTALRRVSDG